MAIRVTHAKQATTPDDPAAEIRSSDWNDDHVVQAWVSVPASSSDSGTTDDIAHDDEYIYICTTTNTWKRVPIASW